MSKLSTSTDYVLYRRIGERGPCLRNMMARALLVVAALLCLPSDAGQAQDTTNNRPLLAIEQLEETRYRALAQSDIRRAPQEGAPKLGLLNKGDMVLVTGRVVGGEWYRIFIDGVGIGYVPGDRIAPAVVGINGDAASAAAATSDAGDGSYRDCDACPEMVPLPVGSYRMGSKAGGASEQPQRDVEIGYRFAVGRYEVTVAEWMACVTAGGCSYEPAPVSKPKRTPVRNLSWDDAQDYVRWLSESTGKPYRLPSEAEWEYAARAGTKTEYWWGNTVGLGKANCKNCGGEWDKRTPAQVGQFEANPYGLHDMNGGVAEWTSDCWANDHAGAPLDGSARQIADCQQRTLRGGSWRSIATDVRSAFRFYYDANVNYSANGLRVAVTLE